MSPARSAKNRRASGSGPSVLPAIRTAPRFSSSSTRSWVGCPSISMGRVYRASRCSLCSERAYVSRAAVKTAAEAHARKETPARKPIEATTFPALPGHPIAMNRKPAMMATSADSAIPAIASPWTFPGGVGGRGGSGSGSLPRGTTFRSSVIRRAARAIR